MFLGSTWQSISIGSDNGWAPNQTITWTNVDYSQARYRPSPLRTLSFFTNWTTRLGFLLLSSSGSANAQLPGCFRPWTFSSNIELNMLPSESFMSCLHFLLGYSTGEFQALQLNVLAVFGAVDYPLASRVLVHFLEIELKMIVGL